MDFNHSTSSKTQKGNKVFFTFLILICLLPWPQGLEVTWQYLTFSFFIFGLSSIYYIKNTQINTLNIVFNTYKKPLIIFGILTLYGLLQIIPLPQSIIELLNPNRLLINTEINTLTDSINSSITISVAPEVSLLELLKNTSYLATFVLCLCLLNSQKRIIRLLNVLFFSSAIIALYSLLNHYTQGSFSFINSIPPWTTPWEKATHGTFSYQNHYASFLTITIPLGIGLIAYYQHKSGSKGLKTPLVNQCIEMVMSKNGFYLLAIFIMILALLKTSSRGGNLVFIASMIFTYMCYLIVNKTNGKKTLKKLMMTLASGLIIIITLIVSGVIDNISNRYEKDGVNSHGRNYMAKTAIKIIENYPLFGTGAGTYPVIQHKYKARVLNNSKMSKRAHNDYLEYLSNQGIIGFSLLITAMLMLYIKLFKQLKKTKSSFMPIKIACFTSVSAISMHSVIDFNFHLPANAIYFFIIFAIGLQAKQLEIKTKR